MSYTIAKMDCGKFMDLIDAATAAEEKMRREYQRENEDVQHELESWAEGEKLYHALAALRDSVKFV